jgi:hypothetical protein
VVDEEFKISYNCFMNKKIELYYEQDKDSGEWIVWFPHPCGGMKVLETFDNELEARTYWQEQINLADFG